MCALPGTCMFLRFIFLVHTLDPDMQGGGGDFVSSYERDQMVQWLRLLTHDFHFCLEVFFRASNLLDTFLSLLKVSSVHWLLGPRSQLCSLAFETQVTAMFTGFWDPGHSYVHWLLGPRSQLCSLAFGTQVTAMFTGFWDPGHSYVHWLLGPRSQLCSLAFGTQVTAMFTGFWDPGHSYVHWLLGSRSQLCSLAFGTQVTTLSTGFWDPGLAVCVFVCVSLSLCVYV